MKPRGSARLTGALLAAGLVVVALMTVALPFANSYANCTTCHATVGGVAATGVHAAVHCGQCHVPASAAGRVRFGSVVLVGMRLGVGDLDSEALRIPNPRCETCHDAESAGVVGSAVRIDHASCMPNDRCVRCHDDVVHGPDQRLIAATDMFECLECHTREAQSLACDVCHEGRLPRERVRTGTFAVTHGAEWERNHGLGSIIACAACHPGADCVECHGSGVPHGQYFMMSHGDSAVSAGAECASCHRQEYCDGCHGMTMPHPSGFKADHAEQVGVQGDAICRTCHGGDDCETCHVLHVHPGGAVGGGLR
ncbi:MAG: hypothetical protein U1E08_08645 [Coriobacteriia bacterium]|nr:hypothetical protein [Actinomycetota bacterium]MDZ4167748.1 hypothetical protein [Coriobacteriia bacterium]